MTNWHTTRIQNIQERIDWLENNSSNWSNSLNHEVEATRFQARMVISRNTNEIERLQNQLSQLQRSA
jgi:chromosome segregation ATPase